MKPALAILAAVLLLSGCGHAKDPFVGTWRAQTNDRTFILISKHESGYLVATESGDDSRSDDFGLDDGADSSFKGVGVLDGHGDTLTVRFAIETIRLTVSPHTRLQAIDVDSQNGPGPVFFVLGLMRRGTLVRVSNSTTAPTPSP